MALNLQIDETFKAEAQAIKDEAGTAGPLSLAQGGVGIGIGATPPQAELDILGSVNLELNGSPRISLHSHGFGAQHYSIRVTNNRDAAGGRRFVIRNVGHARDDVVVDSSGNVSFAGDIKLTNADCAEEFDVGDPAGLSPGTLVSIGRDSRLQISSEPYDRRVAGVVSGAGRSRPAVLLGHQEASGRVAVALMGSVMCKADATDAPIRIGDLLTTSATPGHAMRASDRRRSFGAVIGKALESLDHGQKGTIRALIALQ